METQVFRHRSRYGDYNVFLKKSYYSNGRIRIDLIDASDYARFAIATVNIPDVTLESDEILINENQGIYEFLVSNKIVSPAIGTVGAGYMRAIICKLLYKFD